MKAIYLHAVGALALSFTIAACIPQVDPIVSTPEPVATPAPSPTPVPTPTRTPTPTPTPVVQEPEFANYLDAPQTPGTWIYFANADRSAADFLQQNTGNVFTVSCDGVAREINIERSYLGHAGNEFTMRIVTETAVRSLQARNLRPARLIATLDPNDPLLDSMAITKGRFAVEIEGFPALYLPAWVEVSRVIEDCR